MFKVTGHEQVVISLAKWLATLISPPQLDEGYESGAICLSMHFFSCYHCLSADLFMPAVIRGQTEVPLRARLLINSYVDM